MPHETVFIGFGSNEGDRLDFCDRAITLLSLLPSSQTTGVSSLYETEPVIDDRTNPGPQWFLNGVIRLSTDIPPRKLLEVLREIESALGREPDRQARSGRTSASRTIDLDILFYGDSVITEPDLTIPHPRLHRRRFVLAPLAELAPEFRHPVIGQTVAGLLKGLDDLAAVRRLDMPPTSRYGSRRACSQAGPGTSS
jgi:2-amino-4-hydroxy-6-hydroxymethyldihydropteridine diphosphokinase